MKHKHHDMILAWANGAQVEIRYKDGWQEASTPLWLEKYEFRVKPAAKPCPERMEEYLNELLFRAKKREEQTIALEEDILLALQPKEET